MLFKLIGFFRPRRFKISVLSLSLEIQWCQWDLLIIGPAIFLHFWLTAVGANHTPLLPRLPPTPESQLPLSLSLSLSWVWELWLPNWGRKEEVLVWRRTRKAEAEEVYRKDGGWQYWHHGSSVSPYKECGFLFPLAISYIFYCTIFIWYLMQDLAIL